MASGASPRAIFFLLLAFCTSARAFQGLGGNIIPPTPGNLSDIGGLQDMWMLRGEGDSQNRQREASSDSVSKLDLKAPAPARRECEKGLAFLYKKNLDAAVERLTKSIEIYPSYVAAHNALGSALLDLGRPEQAEKEFAQSVSLDDHLPFSHLNLGWAQMALKKYSSAQESIQKASALAPLDLHLLMALTYAQFLNHDFVAAIATAHQVHERKHENAAIVHYFAAAAWQSQHKFQETQNELQTLLAEAPDSPVAGIARQMIEQIKDGRIHPQVSSPAINYFAAADPANPTPGALPAYGQRMLQQLEEQRQLAEVESQPESDCEACVVADPAGPPGPSAPAPVAGRAEHARVSSSPWVLRSSVNEVAVFFAATDHKRSISDLTRQEVAVRDDGKPPAAVISFRNESQLPLRLGLVIDTSSSITREFGFEQKAAASFLQNVMTGKDDLAFVVGFSSEVLLVQDFTGDQAKIAHGIDQLAPTGGTAIWDAVKFASDKLAAYVDTQPVAKILVVISDGDDNASAATFKQVIERAEREEVIVYTVSTREFSGQEGLGQVGDLAMRALAERSGGAVFFPGSLRKLDRQLADLQQVIRSRYLISYKPAHFAEDGKYRSIAIVAQKSGHKLRVYARHGYYAHPKTAE